MIDNRTAPCAALILRLGTGGLFLAHAALKFFVFTPAGTAKFFESVGLPGPLGPVIILIETIVGFALILGVLPRLAALAGIPACSAPFSPCIWPTASSSTTPKAAGNFRHSGLWHSLYKLCSATAPSHWCTHRDSARRSRCSREKERIAVEPVRPINAAVLTKSLHTGSSSICVHVGVWRSVEAFPLISHRNDNAMDSRTRHPGPES
jgi:putative oxidoreductase